MYVRCAPNAMIVLLLVEEFNGLYQRVVLDGQ
jgi:hypothetical protein